MVVKKFKYKVPKGDVAKMFEIHTDFMFERDKQIQQMNKTSKASKYFIGSDFNYEDWTVTMSINKTKNG